ncbi:MAG: type II toxin-antitoxin system VapC family toxin [Deltaproteobacteria bacterium]|nr:type II toxin-antitoxin system VapC family toxin [Deltaproteobacteria bacterium]MBW2368625.1 type II toxin-antitoxin system VapC family toxin [Deltaproteobacteria bacterium]
MRYLLDTHVFLWMAAAPEKLSQKVKGIVSRKNNHLHLSAASGWEISLLNNLGRIELPDDPKRFVPEAMQLLQVAPIPIGFSTAISAAALPLIHRDPFDRIIIAEAKKEKMTILTKDKQFSAYEIQSLW